MSAVASSTISETKFDKSEILDTVFTFSDLTKSSFKDCKIVKASLFDQIVSLRGVSFSGSEFKDVFFAGSDLTGADFRGVKGLKPEYFYAAKNIDKAVFDEKEFKEKVNDVKESDYIKFINDSELTKQRKDAIFLTLCEVEYSVDTLERTKKIDSCKEDFKKKAQKISK